jgi:hypothetical protein
MKEVRKSKKELSQQINSLLGLIDSEQIDFSRLTLNDLERLYNILSGKPKTAVPFKVTVETERKSLLPLIERRRPLRDLVERVLER